MASLAAPSSSSAALATASLPAASADASTDALALAAAAISPSASPGVAPAAAAATLDPASWHRCWRRAVTVWSGLAAPARVRFVRWGAHHPRVGVRLAVPMAGSAAAWSLFASAPADSVIEGEHGVPIRFVYTAAAELLAAVKTFAREDKEALGPVPTVPAAEAQRWLAQHVPTRADSDEEDTGAVADASFSPSHNQVCARHI